MGKTKQEKKFDRNVEISAPILDPEIIKQIHSPPEDRKRDIRHGGFKALLSDLNSQDSTDELTPITDNHLPSYIGISCAVSGYSNYSAYGRKPFDESSTKSDTKTHKFATTSSKQTPNRSQTNSPFAVKVEQYNIHHVTIDKSNINSVDEERRELTEKLTASAAERRQSPSPIPPTEDDRHHGAYVGARYFPMPEPSKLVNKHIPLLGIDDDVDPDDVVVKDVNKVEQKIASLYGENFVEDWKESMSHKSKKELHDDKQAEKVAPVNLKETVSLKPTPPKAPQPDEPVQVDIPTPNVKVLANVEKQFLNRLLTDENPPMPKSPSPLPTSPVSPKLASPTRTTETHQHHGGNYQDSPQASTSPPSHQEQSSASPDPRHGTPEPVSVGLEPVREEPEQVAPAHDSPEPMVESSQHSLNDLTTQAHLASNPETLITSEGSRVALDSNQVHQTAHLADGYDLPDTQHEHQQQFGYRDEVDISNSQGDPTSLEAPGEAELADREVQVAASSGPCRSRSSSTSSSSSSSSSSGNSRRQAKSPESQVSSSTVERAPMDKQQHEPEHSEAHIEYGVQEESPQVNNESSPVKVPESNESLLVTAKEVVIQDTDNPVSFSPEPGLESTPETNNNFEDQPEKNEDHSKATAEETVAGGGGSAGQTGGAFEEVATGALGADEQHVSGASEEIKDGHYFLDLLKREESFIMERVRLAEQLLAEHGGELDEERLGRIHSAIGKANLLINKKCNQFRELCEKGISGDANDQYAVLNDDLAGFWDMISIQIADVRKSLENP